MLLESLVGVYTICGDRLYNLKWTQDTCELHILGRLHLGQLALYYPNKFSKFVFFSGPFIPPGQANDIPRFNAMAKKILGYEQTGYWYAFTEEGFGKVIGDHVSFVANSRI
jgi:hypothetical protein